MLYTIKNYIVHLRNSLKCTLDGYPSGSDNVIYEDNIVPIGDVDTQNQSVEAQRKIAVETAQRAVGVSVAMLKGEVEDTASGSETPQQKTEEERLDAIIKKMEELNARLLATESALNEAETQVTKLNTELGEAEARAKTAEEQVIKLYTELGEADNREKSLTEELRSLREEENLLKMNNEKALARITELETKIVENEKIAGEDRDNLLEEVAALEEALKFEKGAKEEVLARISELENKVTALEEENATLENENTDLTSDIASLEAENLALRTEKLKKGETLYGKLKEKYSVTGKKAQIYLDILIAYQTNEATKKALINPNMLNVGTEIAYPTNEYMEAEYTKSSEQGEKDKKDKELSRILDKAINYNKRLSSEEIKKFQKYFGLEETGQLTREFVEHVYAEQELSGTLSKDGMVGPATKKFLLDKINANVG